MNLKKMAVCILAVLCVALFISCKSEQEATQNVVVDENNEYINDLLIEDYEGYNFRILIQKTKRSRQVVDEETGNVIDDSVFKRNEIVKNMLNIDITATESSSSGSETDAMSSILAGDDQYDMILPHSRSAFQYAIQNTLINFNEVETIRLDKPWWHKDIVENCNINGNLYVIDGDIQITGLSTAYGLYFNKTIFDELGIEYPYRMVKNGEWTFDEFSKLVKKGTKDLNGDGVLTPENDRFGWYTGEWASPVSFLYSSGQRIYSKDAKGIPQLSLNTPKTVDFFNKYLDLVSSENTVLTTTGTSGGYCVNIGGVNLFTEGRALFYDGSLGLAQNMRSMTDDFGIIPIPKFTADDEYATIVGGHASLVVMPITVEDENKSGNIMEALCAVGSKEVVPAFYEVSLKTKFARDEESEEMIDIIRNSIVYDLGYVSGGTFDSIGYNLVHTGGGFSSTYAANESLALQKLKEFNRAYGKIK